MALAKYLEDIVERFHEDLEDFIADREVEPSQQERRSAACRLALAQVQAQLEKLLEMATDPEIRLADEVDYHRTKQTSLERMVSAQAERIRELEARIEELSNGSRPRLGGGADLPALGANDVNRRLSRLVQRAYRRELTSEELDLVRQIQLRLGVTVTEPALYLAAMTHRSLRRPESRVVGDNRQLTTIGSRVLDLCLASLVVLVQPETETVAVHDVSRAFADTSTCARKGRALGLHELLLVGPGFARAVDLTDTIISDALRALIGAVYLDLGFDASQELMMRWYARNVDSALERYENARNAGVPQKILSAKNRLQELTQGRGLGLPEYRLLSKQGSEQAPIFVVEARVRGGFVAHGRGPSKRAAESAAAEAVLAKLGQSSA